MTTRHSSPLHLASSYALVTTFVTGLLGVPLVSHATEWVRIKAVAPFAPLIQSFVLSAVWYGVVAVTAASTFLACAIVEAHLARRHRLFVVSLSLYLALSALGQAFLHHLLRYLRFLDLPSELSDTLVMTTPFVVAVVASVVYAIRERNREHQEPKRAA